MSDRVTTFSRGPASATAPGHVTTGTQTFAGDKTFTGATTFNGTLTVNKTAEASTNETIATFKVTDDATAKLEVYNFASSDSLLVPGFLFTGNGVNTGSYFRTNIGTDSGSAACMQWDFRRSGAVVNNRPLLDVSILNTTVFSWLPLNSGANMAMSWGTQAENAPTFTTRSGGTRIVTYAQVDGTHVDSGIGSNGVGVQWYSVAQANSSHAHYFYAGQTLVHSIFGNGQVTSTGSQVDKVRVATTSPVTVAAGTDYIVITKLGTPAAVTVNLPASPTTGLTYVVKDGTGDAGTNTVTITPAAGTIDGAATATITINYGSKTFVYNGAEWNVI